MPKHQIVRVDVDTQFGFCDPNGGLYVTGAEAVLPTVARLNRDAVARGFVLMGSVDSHDYASDEFITNGGPWPVHCVKGTRDWLKEPSTLPARSRFVGRDATDVAAAFAEGEAALYFEKDRYSLFDNHNAEPFLELIATQARASGRHLRFEVYGVATDYCVKAAALALRERGHAVRVIRDATCGVTAAGHDAALLALEAAGVEVVTSASVLHPTEPAAHRESAQPIEASVRDEASAQDEASA